MNPNDNDAPQSASLDAELPPVDIAKPVQAAAPKPPVVERVASSLWHCVLPIMFLLLMFMIAIYFAPMLLYHWQIMSAHAEAEGIYTKRRAELKAEAEHADQRLDVLDRRNHLTSLGFREVARKVMPVVVNVANFREPSEKDWEEIKAKRLTLVFDPQNDKKYVQYGVGSGLILKPGVILTNHHVIRKAQRLRISFASGRSIGVDADAAVSDVRTDLAVIKLPDNLPAALKEETQTSAEFADSEKDVHVGEWVLAMGSPLGLRQTVTHGIISAKGRLLSTLDLVELLQTDAAINPGNSGGPLFDQMGRVVGINTMIASDTGLSEGLGFAIPSNTVRKISEQLLTKGEVPRGYLGIGMDDLPGPDAKTLKIDDGAVLVKMVEPGQPADKAGIQVGDIILRINKETLQRQKPIRHVRQIVADFEPGAEIIVEVLRGEERRRIVVTVGKRPAHLP